MRSTKMRGRTLLVNCVMAALLAVSQVLKAGPAVTLITFTIDDSPVFVVSGDRLDPATEGGPGVTQITASGPVSRTM